ncbi:RsbT co-antagonist protein RsbRA [Falsibacillus albus]|uniref:STAS domain-containing protein n=1 Tax=Falsibacillus albus TaxID=2478915 RepID=A0A3L7JU71_9BACI|nr:RsbT co-antagonist protein RsbRA [Falsibacillus albus]RLQ93171.1 STAS domain-containing protein [Falsibacillus albus]
MYQELVDYIHKHQDEILSNWMDGMKGQTDERLVGVVSDQVFTRTSREFVDLLISNLVKDDDFNLKLEDFAAKVIRLGWPLTFVTKGMQTFGKIVFEDMRNAGIIPDEKLMEFGDAFDKWMSPMYHEVVSVYTETWEKTVSLQKIALQELSAPLIPVVEKISVLPLVGTIDTERAKLIMENLLTGVVKHRAEVVLIDITGVPVVDTMVAHHIIQAAGAVRLVGAKCMLVGIRPEIAQTIVNLGINLNEIITTSTLRKGIEAALELTNRKIVELEG